tara:strand:- start:50 stop:787 length:738 start_codon:yes stop_codon:yes gene_type:complete
MKNKIVYLLTAVLVLAGCSNSNKYIEIDESFVQKQSKNIQINYIPNINVITKDASLLNYLKEDKTKRFKITDKNFAVLNLFIDTSLEVDPLEKGQPKLVGILKKQKHKYNYKVKYKLVDSIGNTVVQGDTLGLSDEMVETIASVPTKPSQTSVKDAAAQIIEKINPEIKEVLIDFKIVSVSAQSVFIAINDGITLNKEEIFLVNDLPSTALTLEGVVQSNDITLAELKVLTGQFPKVGMTVNLQK